MIDDSRPVENVTEWAKREACWKQAQEIDIQLEKSFIDELAGIEDVKQRQKEAVKDQKENNKVSAMVAVAEFGVENWKELLSWNSTHHVLNENDISFVNAAIKMETGYFPSEKQCAKILKVLDKAREESFPK